MSSYFNQGSNILDSFNFTKKPSQNIIKSKNCNKLKIPINSNKAYKKLLKNISLFSLDSTHNMNLNNKIINSCKNGKKINICKKKKKGNSNISESRNKYRTQCAYTKPKLQSCASMIDNHIIITPTSLSNAIQNEIKIPRFASRKDVAKSCPKSEYSEDDERAGSMIGKLGHSSTWDNRNCNSHPHKVISNGNNDTTQNTEKLNEDEKKCKSPQEDPLLAQTFLNECETLEEVITNLLKEIDEEKQSEQQKQEK